MTTEFLAAWRSNLLDTYGTEQFSWDFESLTLVLFIYINVTPGVGLLWNELWISPMGRKSARPFLLYNDILDGTVLGVVLLRCRIFSTKEWRACLDACHVVLQGLE